eukprot:m.1273320 g.1273320  ORF g.1273320 m.1273320 type:complete len:66 (-) comp24753_c0_seq4:655-852(-)
MENMRKTQRSHRFFTSLILCYESAQRNKVEARRCRAHVTTSGSFETVVASWRAALLYGHYSASLY